MIILSMNVMISISQIIYFTLGSIYFIYEIRRKRNIEKEI